MAHERWLRLISAAAGAFGAAATARVIFTRSAADLEQLLFFTALVAVVAFFAIRTEDVRFGFEAAVIFPAILLLHDPALALVAVFVGLAGHELWRRRSLRESSLLAISYFIVALLYTSAVNKNAPPLAKISGYILLVVGFLGIRIAFLAAREAPKRLLVLQAEIIAVITPIVAMEVMSDVAYGHLGLALALLPLLVIAYTMRREMRIAERNAELVRRNRELSILTESATSVLLAETEGETIRQIVALLSKLARLKAAAVVTWDVEPLSGTTVYRFGECLPSDQELIRWVESAGFAQSAPNRPFVFQNELRRFPLAPEPAIQVIIGIQTAAAIHGILVYETEDRAILQGGSLNLLTLLVNQTAVSLDDQLLRLNMVAKNAELERNAATMSTILELSTSLIASTDIEDSLTRVAMAIRNALEFDAVVFAVRDPRRDEFVRRAQAGIDSAAWEEMRGKPLASQEIRPFIDTKYRILNSYFIPRTGPDAWLKNDVVLVPLVSAGETIGYLSAHSRSGEGPRIERVRTLEIFAVQAVMAIESAQRYGEIRRLTFIDGLTPAYNYRYFQEAFAKELNRHKRTGNQLALCMLDIDNFKRINDTFGHPVGDVILKGLVEELMRNRESDVVARYGGEEFALIFPDTPAASAKEAANRMRELIERREFVIPELRRTLRVTASIGVAVFPSDGTTSTDLIARADAALYFAKKHGKNLVMMAGELPAQGAGVAS